MVIGIDGNEANIDQRVGVNQYAYNLLWSIYKLQDEWKDSHSFLIYLKNEPTNKLPKPTDHWKYKVIKGRGLWIIKNLMPHLYLQKQKQDIFFTPSHYVPPFAPMPRVCAIMDLGYLEFSGQFRAYDYWQLKLWSAWSITVSKYIIAISKATSQDIVRHYKSSSKKVKVTLLGYDSDTYNRSIPFLNVRRAKKRYTISGDYILFISTLKPSKNIEGLIEAWSQISDRNPGVTLVIAGKKGWLYSSIFEKASKLGVQDKVVFTDFIEESYKPGLIKGAKLFAMPSFWEGFGIDVVSAMASGVPVLVSNKGSLPEIVGNAGIIVNPYNIDDIAEKMHKLLNMSKVDYNNRVKKGLKQAQKYSWDKTARKTIEILEMAGK